MSRVVTSVETERANCPNRYVRCGKGISVFEAHTWWGTKPLRTEP